MARASLLIEQASRWLALSWGLLCFGVTFPSRRLPVVFALGVILPPWKVRGPAPLLMNPVEGLATWNLIRVTPKSLRSQQCGGWASSCIWGPRQPLCIPGILPWPKGEADEAVRQGDV